MAAAPRPCPPAPSGAGVSAGVLSLLPYSLPTPGTGQPIWRGPLALPWLRHRGLGPLPFLHFNEVRSMPHALQDPVPLWPRWLGLSPLPGPEGQGQQADEWVGRASPTTHTFSSQSSFTARLPGFRSWGQERGGRAAPPTGAYAEKSPCSLPPVSPAQQPFQEGHWSLAPNSYAPAMGAPGSQAPPSPVGQGALPPPRGPTLWMMPAAWIYYRDRQCGSQLPETPAPWAGSPSPAAPRTLPPLAPSASGRRGTGFGPHSASRAS